MSTFIPARATGSRAKFVGLLLGSLAGVLTVGAAGAASPDSDLTSVVVKYSRESLANDAGVNELYRRINSAAKQVCPDVSSRDLAGQQKVKQCRAQAVAVAIRQIDNSRLAALHAGRSKNG
jgi:UrcA family protein